MQRGRCGGDSAQDRNRRRHTGANTNDLISEFTAVSNRMLGRAQSAELGNL
jgi:hypothetical protein